LINDISVVVRDGMPAGSGLTFGVPETIDLAVCDVSFISITMILPVLPNLLAKDAEMVILVKPQFELERKQVGKGGVIRDPALHQQACQRVEDAVRRLGLRSDIIPSPVLGAEGNQEFLLYARH
jgi:23S rRNA (cytidine1920-2'-O)/16S rRNA (cytidine1409-2'-O)-methyltransferase